MSSLTQMILVGVDDVLLDGAGETEQLDQPALFYHQSFDVAARQDLQTTNKEEEPLEPNRFN